MRLMRIDSLLAMKSILLNQDCTNWANCRFYSLCITANISLINQFLSVMITLSMNVIRVVKKLELVGIVLCT